MERNEKLKIDWQFIGIVIFFAFILRFVWALILKPHEFYFDDSLQWNQIALNFLDGKGLIINESAKAYRPPIYPLFLSIIYFIFGKVNLMAVRIIQAILSSITCLIVYFIGREIFNEKTGKISMVVCSIYPFFVYYSGAILSETISIFIISLLMLMLVRKKFFWVGFFLGLAALSRGEILSFVIFIVIGLFVTSCLKEALKNSFTLIVILIFTISPWVIRNYFIFNKFVPLSTMSGLVLYAGNNPLNMTGGGIQGRDFVIPEVVSGMSEVESDQYLKKEAIKFIKSNPYQFLKLSCKKFKYFWNIKLNTRDLRYASTSTNLGSIFSFGPILFLFIGGLFLSWNNREKLIYFYFLILDVMLVNLIFIASLRYRLPIEPYMIIIASYTFSLGLNRLSLKLLKKENE